MVRDRSFNLHTYYIGTVSTFIQLNVIHAPLDDDTYVRVVVLVLATYAPVILYDRAPGTEAVLG